MKNVIYKLVNRKKLKSRETPHSYIGSKSNYVPGKYWGSSRHPVLLQELETNIKDFNVEILEYVKDKKQLIKREAVWQKKFDVVKNKEYYNLVFANEKFSTLGKKWAYDPISSKYACFPESKIPENWILGFPPGKRSNRGEEWCRRFSKKMKEISKKGKDHRDAKKWILVDPLGKKQEITSLYTFCQKNNLSPTALQYSFISKKPIKKGKSKGWYVMDKKEKGL